jgi:hypothetical protein
MVARGDGFAVCDKSTRFRESNDKASIVKLALARDVGNEEFRKIVVEGIVVRTTRDRDRRTVHVHLTVSDLIEPSPGEGCVAVLHAFRDLELEVLETLALVITSALSSRWSSIRIGSDLSDVALGSNRTATNVTVNDLPLGLVGRRRIVVSHTELTRATTMDSTTSEFEVIVLADLHGVGNASAIKSIGTTSALAGKVVTLTVERRCLESAEAIRCWGVHNNMGVGLCGERKD